MPPPAFITLRASAASSRPPGGHPAPTPVSHPPQRAPHTTTPSRRAFLLSSAVAAAAAGTAAVAEPSHAVPGLPQFPLTAALSNRYITIRAGECRTDAAASRLSNPVLNVSHPARDLTTRGVSQVLRAADAAAHAGVGRDAQLWIWSALATNALQTADLLAGALGVPGVNVVPEFSFLDPRGLGELEGRAEEEVARGLREVDARMGRMGAAEDGTPNESVEDVFVRVRQLLGKLETQYSGVDVLLVGADSDTLAVFECALCNRPLRTLHDIDYAPGEVRIINPVLLQ